MHTRILRKIREKIRSEEYVRCAHRRLRLTVLTTHAEEEMANDDFIEVDVETAILNGRIIRRERDSFKRGSATALSTKRAKYIIEGVAIDGRKMQIVCRFSDSGHYVVIITVYEVME